MDLAVIELRAAAFLGGEELVKNGIIDAACDGLALVLYANGDCDMGNALHEIGRPVDRVNDPLALGVSALCIDAVLLAGDSVFRVEMKNGIGDGALALAVDVGYEIVLVFL